MTFTHDLQLKSRLGLVLVLVVGSSGSSSGIAMPPYNQCPVKPSLGLAALLGVGLIPSVYS